MTYNDIITGLRNTTHNKIGTLSNLRAIVNSAVSEVASSVNLRSLKRITNIPYSVHNEVNRYACPSDMNRDDIINIRKQVDSTDVIWKKTDTVDFFRRQKAGMIAVDTSLRRKTLLINASNDEQTATLDALDTYDADGTWIASGDASNVRTDSVNYVEGTGSVRFDLESGATTATLTKTADTPIDISDYEGNSDIYMFADMPIVSGINSYELRIGEDSANYYTTTVTATADNLSFGIGWDNLLKFGFDTKVGTPDMSNTLYYQININKDAGMDATTDFRIDNMVILMGNLYQTVYYSKYIWEASDGSRKENSTADLDTLAVESDEEKLIITKVNEKISQALRESTDQAYWRDEYSGMKKDYKRNNPSEKLATTTTYYNLDY